MVETRSRSASRARVATSARCRARALPAVFGWLRVSLASSTFGSGAAGLQLGHAWCPRYAFGSVGCSGGGGRGVERRGLGLVRHRGSVLACWKGRPAGEGRSREGGAGRGSPRRGRRRPRTAETSKGVQSTARQSSRAGLGFRDLEAVDLVADGDRTDVPGLDVAPDVADGVAFREPDAGDALSVLDPGRARHDRADHRVEIVRLVHLQEGRARVQPFEPDMLGGHAELLVMRLAEERGAPHPGAGRPDHLDAARLRVDAVRRKLRRPAERRQFDRLLHVWILVRPRQFPDRPDRSRGRPAHWLARCRSW
jgi:hypothetical protein